MSDTKPAPGSPLAVTYGCTCPTVENGNGRGYRCDDGSRHLINDACPMHRPDRRRPKLKLVETGGGDG